MFFQLDDYNRWESLITIPPESAYTLTVTQILELLDQNQLNREGIRALTVAQKK